jgi:hypothetical protein
MIGKCLFLKKNLDRIRRMCYTKKVAESSISHEKSFFTERVSLNKAMMCL